MSRIRFRHHAAFAAVLSALVGCADREDAATQLPETAPPLTEPRVAGSGSYTMGDMAAHMRSMDGMRTDTLQAMMPMYGERVDSMLVQMNRDVTARNVPPDPRWAATVDSIRSDLTRMPGMSPVELQTFMFEHRDRMRRTMEAHRRMMLGTGT
jgi:hypothetical protein